MLVLSRKDSESVVIGSDGGSYHTLTVKVLEIRKGKVRLGIEADGTVRIQRAETRQALTPARRISRDQ